MLRALHLGDALANAKRATQSQDEEIGLRRVIIETAASDLRPKNVQSSGKLDPATAIYGFHTGAPFFKDLR